MAEHIEVKEFDNEVIAYFDTGGGIVLKAVSPIESGDPVELSSSAARALAQHLVHLADFDDAN